MINQERLLTLRAAHNSRLRVALPHHVVGDIDDFLRGYGISEPLAAENLVKRARCVLNRRDLKAFLRIFEARNDVYGNGDDTSKVDLDFYNAICSDPLLGVVHSVKRAYILDATVVLHWTIEALRIDGPVLDVGCHAGYHVNWLARSFDRIVIGVDAAENAIAYATKRNRSTAATFVWADVRRWCPAQTFDVLFLNYGPFAFHHDDSDLVRLVNDNLNPDGVVISIGDTVREANIEQIQETARRCGLSLGLADVAGGWLGDHFERTPVLMFVKDSAADVPSGMLLDADRVWTEEFINYANNPSTPWREKTQAFCRATLPHED